GLIKFDISQLDHVTSAKLLIYNNSVANASTVAVYGVDPDGWSEETATWNTRPTPGTAVLDTASIPENQAQYNELDVTEYVYGFDGDIIAFQLQIVESHQPV